MAQTKPVLTIANLDEAPRSALIAFCKEQLGINPGDAPDNIIKGKVAAFLRAHGTQAAPAVVKNFAKNWDLQDTVVLMIPSSNFNWDKGKAASRAVYVNFNGHELFIPRNTHCRVPRGVAEILANAIHSDMDPDTKQMYDVQAFPYMVIPDTMLKDTPNVNVNAHGEEVA